MYKHSVRFGLLAGAGTVLCLLIFYFIDRPLMLSPSVIWSTILLYIIAMYMAPNELKKDNGGYLPFRQAISAAFVVYLVANAVYYAFHYIHYNFFDPSMIDVQRNLLLENVEETADFFGEEFTEAIEERADNLEYGLFTTISSYIGSLIGGFILATLVALFVRTKPVTNV